MYPDDIPFYDIEPEFSYLDFSESDLEELAFLIEEDASILSPCDIEDPLYRLTFEREPDLFQLPCQKVS